MAVRSIGPSFPDPSYLVSPRRMEVEDIVPPLAQSFFALYPFPLSKVSPDSESSLDTFFLLWFVHFLGYAAQHLAAFNEDGR